MNVTLPQVQKRFCWTLTICIYENSKYLKSTAGTSVTKCDEGIIAIDVVSINKTNTIATKKTNTVTINVTITVSINCHSKNICYIATFATFYIEFY